MEREGFEMGPHCSVVIPVYNSETTIKQAVESVLNQTYADFELIVVDDGSSDHSFEMLKNLAKRDGRIRLLKNQENRGVAFARNRGIEASIGKYLALLDSDDLWLPDKLDRQISFMEKKECPLSHCSYGFIDHEGNLLGKMFCVPQQIDLPGLLKRNVISCSTVMGDRELFLKHPFNQEYYHEDFVEWIDLMRECKQSLGIERELARIRIMNGSRSGDKRNSARQRWRVYREYMNMGTLQAAYYYINYVFFSLLKYRTLRKGLANKDG